MLSHHKRDEAEQTVSQIALDREAPLIQMGVDYLFKGSKSIAGWTNFQVKSEKSGENTELDIGLLGQHQIENASTAYVALQVLREQGIFISESAIHEGFASTRWPGRFEILCLDPPIVVDSAHNPDSARRIMQAMDEYFPGRPLVIIFGVSEDKNIDGMIQELLTRNTIFYLLPIDPSSSNGCARVSESYSAIQMSRKGRNTSSSRNGKSLRDCWKKCSGFGNWKYFCCSHGAN